MMKCNPRVPKLNVSQDASGYLSGLIFGRESDGLVQVARQQNTITHKNVTELIPKQFRFGNSSTKITEYNSHSNSVKDSVILCSRYLPRPINSRNKSVWQSQSRNYRKKFEKNKVRFGNLLVCNGNHKGGTVIGGYWFGYVSDMYPSPF